VGEVVLEATEQPDRGYSRRVGAQLLAIRKQRHLSRHAVEQLSDGEFKASVICAYERGERSVSVPKLQRLAAFYQVPVDSLLPPDTDGHWTKTAMPRPEPVCLNLDRLGLVDGPAGELLGRFVRSLQQERGDYGGRLLTIRDGDLAVIASMLGLNRRAAEELVAPLQVRTAC